MTLALIAIVCGLAVLVWSADRFVEGSSSLAARFGLPPLLIGMVIVGFGTSAPEMTVSGLAAWKGNAGIALGNAYGSNITNIALILGLTALLAPIPVSSRVLRSELPLLTLVTALAAWQVWDGEVSRTDAAVLLMTFLVMMGWMIWNGLRQEGDTLATEFDAELRNRTLSRGRALLLTLVGLALLIASSRVLVWGAVEVAKGLGVSDLVIGLTIVAVGTSLPELASSLIAARKGEHGIALGNIIGSNLFNTLAVVGVAAAIRPLPVESGIITRDMVWMGGLTLSLFIVGWAWRSHGRISRLEGALLLGSFVAYTGWLVIGSVGG